MKNIAIVGGSGFVGRHLVPVLANRGHQCRVLTRRPHRHRDLEPAARVCAVDPFDRAALRKALAGCDTVINLVGILNQSSRNGFRRVHVELVENIVAAAHDAGLTRMLHMSALNADQGAGSSQYLRTRGEGENRAHTLGQPHLAVTSFRPSVIFGPDDSFLNRFAPLVRIPGPIPLARADTRFAPVYVEDVAQAFANALQDRATHGRNYPLCGPEVYTLREIIQAVAHELGIRKTVIGLPDTAGRLQAQVLQYVPGKPFTPDNFDSMRRDSVCERNGFAELGIEPRPMSALIGQFLQHRDRNAARIALRRLSRR